MRITLTSVLVDDQAKALDFYTRVLGFEKKYDVPMGEFAWLTVVSPDAPDGVELAARARPAPRGPALQGSTRRRRHPLHRLHRRRRRGRARPAERAGVVFTQPPTSMGPVTTAVFDDTCGNLIQIQSPVAA